MKFKLVLLILLTLATIGATDAMGQWVTNGPYGGFVNVFARMGPTLFACTNGSIYRSRDSGANWAPSNVGLSNHTFVSICAIGSNILASTNTNFGYSDSIFRSTDSGLSWKALSAGLIPYQGPYQPVAEIFAVSNSYLFAGTADGTVFRSADSGVSWSAVTTWSASDFGIETLYIEAIVTIGSTVVVATNAVIFRSSDNGDHWAIVDEDAQTLTAHGTTIYAGTNTGVLQSMDSGNTWLPSGLDSENIYSFASDGTNLFAGTYGDSVFRSTDNGLNWTPSSEGITEAESQYAQVHALAVMGQNVVVGTENGLFLSADTGTSWVRENDGFASTFVISLFANGNSLYAGTTEDSVFVTNDSGSQWNSSSSGITMSQFVSSDQIESFAVSGKNLYLATLFDGVFKSSDNGTSWNWLPASQIGATYSVTSVSSFLLIGTDDGIYRSSDSGVTWTYSNSGTQIGYLAAVGSTLWAAGLAGGIIRSENGGDSWENASTGLSSSAFVTSFVEVGDEILAGTSAEGIYRSSDNGQSWQQSGVVNRQVNSIITIGPFAFAGTMNGIYISTDQGESWNAENTGLTNTSVYSLAADGNNLFAGTYDGGVWRRPLSEMIGSSSVAEAPQHANTTTIFPNPVSHEATIGFATNTSSQTSVTIFDVLGNTIDELFDGTLEAGSHLLTWNASAVSPGTYYARIATKNGDVQTVKVVKN